MDGNEIAAITNVINLYPLAVDGKRWDLFDHVFTPDVTADFGGQAVWHDLAALKQAFDMIHAPFAATQHATRGHHVALDGDRATCLSYVNGCFIRDVPQGESRFESGGWYDDQLMRTPAGWRIARRTCRMVWWSGNPAVLETVPGVKVEQVLDSLCADAAAGKVAHFQALERLLP